MRFPKETRALLHQAGANPVSIPWPAGASEPQRGRIYWMQSAEDLEAERAERKQSPDTHAEVMAAMLRRNGREPEAKKKRRRSVHRPYAGDPRIFVIDVAILDIGWEVKAVRYEDPDPIHHLRVKAKVPAGPNPISGKQEPTETEPEQIIAPSDHQRHLEEEDALRIAHKASIDHSSVLKAERHLLDQRRKGKPSPLAEQALERVKRRAVESSAAISG